MIFTSSVDDLNLVEISVADYDTAPDKQHLPSDKKFKVILVSLSSSKDIGPYVLAHHWTNLHADITFCNGAGKLGWGGVYYSGIDLSSIPYDASARDRYNAMIVASPKGAPYVYQTWFNYRMLGNRTGHDFVDYDLRKSSDDVCVRIAALPYMAVGRGLVSNTVVVSSESIQRALTTGLGESQ